MPCPSAAPFSCGTARGGHAPAGSTAPAALALRARSLGAPWDILVDTLATTRVASPSRLV
eukprot:3796982-Prymnesium_polylepis.1